MKNEDKYGKYLPIGTVVLLKEGEKRLMIIGFSPAMNNDGKKRVFDYCGTLFPEGVFSMKHTFLFNHDQIKKIFHMGLYNDDEARAFHTKLKEV